MASTVTRSRPSSGVDAGAAAATWFRTGVAIWFATGVTIWFATGVATA
ncbi:MAG: hypothetical protein ACKOTB_03145 [Planctomycetia bacterium]